MDKEGHIGVVKNAAQPIKKVEKIELNQMIMKNPNKHNDN